MSKANGGQPFDTFSDALTYADRVLLASQKKGGMTIKYVQSSDNKYVQYFLTKDEWSASEADWEKMNLEEEVSQLGQEVNNFTTGEIFTEDGFYNATTGVFNPHSSWKSTKKIKLQGKEISGYFYLPNAAKNGAAVFFKADGSYAGEYHLSAARMGENIIPVLSFPNDAVYIAIATLAQYVEQSYINYGVPKANVLFSLLDDGINSKLDTINLEISDVESVSRELSSDIEEIQEELSLSSAVASLHFDNSLQHILAKQAIKAVWLTYGSLVTTDAQRAQVDALYAQLKTTKLYITDLYNVEGTYGCFLQIKDAETGGTNCFSKFVAGIHTISGEEEVWDIVCRQNTILWPAGSALNTYPFFIHFAIDWNVLTNKRVTTNGDNAIEVDFGELNWGERKETETIKEAVEELQQNSTSLSSIDLSGKNIVCIGDSLTEMVDANNKHYSDYIGERTGATTINIGFGGTQLRQRRPMAEDFDALPESTEAEISEKSRYAYATIDIINLVKAIVTNDFTEQAKAVNWLANNRSDDNTAILARIKAIDWTEVDSVTIFAGTNDWASNNPILGPTGGNDPNYTLGAINEIIRLLLSTFKQLKIYWFTPIVRWVDYSGGTGIDADWSDVKYYNSTDGTLKQFAAAIENEVSLNHIPVCDLYNTLGWNKNNFSEYFNDNDGTHPRKTSGVTYLAKRIGAFILANNAL